MVRTPSCGGAARARSAGCRRLAKGEVIGAFALTEPDAGSDASAIETRRRPDGGSYVLERAKKWITFGQIADLFLVFAQLEASRRAFLVERDTPGVLGHADRRGTRAPGPRCWPRSPTRTCAVPEDEP